MLLIVFAGMVYYFYTSFRPAEYYKRLEYNAINTAKLLIQVPGIDSTMLAAIEYNAIYFLGGRKVMIYTPEKKLLFSTPKGTIPDEIIGKIFPQIKKGKTIKLKQGDDQLIGLIFSFNNQEYYVIASAYDQVGEKNLRTLRQLFLISIIITIIIIYLVGMYFSKKALSPIPKVINLVNSITAGKLNERIKTGNESDEISLVADTFNHMLDRLQEVFELQQSFVSNASHGIRTPLNTVAGQIEMALLKQYSPAEYEDLLRKIQNDIRNLSNLANNLLYLAQTSSDVARLLVYRVRVDEVLLQSQTELEQLNKNYSIIIDFEKIPEDDSQLTVFSNESLLKTVFLNLMDNACKFSSNNKAFITISFAESIIIKVSDHGRGISESDQNRIFKPFYRGTNTSDIKGHGIGLSLVKRILELHHGKMQIHSQLGSGTTVTVHLPIIKS